MINDDIIQPIIEKEDSIDRFFSKNVEQYMQRDTFSNLVPFGSQPDKINGLANVHREISP